MALEGIDGSGKGTQTVRLAEALVRKGWRTERIAFPRYQQTFFGQRIGDFLNGRFGSLEDVHPFLASLLYATDRFQSLAELSRLRESAAVLVADRYTASNLAHQGAKVPADQRGQLVEWIEEVEHRVFGLPRADLTIWLDVSVANAQQLIARKSARDYTDRKADLQEENAQYLAAVRGVYEDLCRTNGSWRRVACEVDGRLRELDDIASEIEQLVTTALPGC